MSSMHSHTKPETRSLALLVIGVALVLGILGLLHWYVKRPWGDLASAALLMAIPAGIYLRERLRPKTRDGDRFKLDKNPRP